MNGAGAIFLFPEAHLYAMRRRATDPVALALMARSFVPERHESRAPWILLQATGTNGRTWGGCKIPWKA